MSKNRCLTEELRYFVLDKQSEQRNVIINYVLNNINMKEQSVAMCFRGKYISLYYRCHMLLLMQCDKSGKIYGEFNFRHSRFTEDFEEKKERLRKDLHVYNFKEKKYVENGVEKTYYSPDSIKIRFNIAKAERDGDKWTYKGLIDADKFKEILDIYRGLIEDFVNPDPEHSVYRWQGENDKPKAGTVAKKSRNTEKNAQQMLYAQYFNCEEKLIYDLEYTEHGISEKEAAQLSPEELDKKKVHGRFDLLALVHEDGGDVLEFIELKSTLSACKQKESGVRSHIKDYMKYLEDDERVKARMEEALDAIAILRKIFGIPFEPKPFKTPVRARVRFILTDEAAEKYDFPIAVTKHNF